MLATEQLRPLGRPTPGVSANVARSPCIPESTLEVMKKLGLTPDSWVYRSVEAQYITAKCEIVPNRHSMALVRRDENSPAIEAKGLDAPGLNVSILPSRYHDWRSGTILTRFRVSDALERGGEILEDVGGKQSSISAYITIPRAGPLPIQIIPNQQRELVEKILQHHERVSVSARSDDGEKLGIEAAAQLRELEKELDVVCSKATLRDAFPRRHGQHSLVEGNNPIAGGVFITGARSVIVASHNQSREPTYVREFVDFVAEELKQAPPKAEKLFAKALEYARSRLPQQPSFFDLVADRVKLLTMERLVARGRGTDADKLLLAAECLEYLMAPGNNVVRGELRLDSNAEANTATLSLRQPGQWDLPTFRILETVSSTPPRVW